MHPRRKSLDFIAPASAPAEEAEAFVSEEAAEAHVKEILAERAR